jgi:ribosome-associated protein
LEPIELARKIVESLEDMKGEDILLLDVQDLSPIGMYYVIASGSSERTVRGLMNAVVGDLKQEMNKPQLEGKAQDGWLLADYGTVVVHVFSKLQRDYYRLEELWADAKVLLHVQ